VTDTDFTKAIRSDSEAAQNPAQQAHPESRSDSHAADPAHEKAPVILRSATSCETLQHRGMGDTGLEQSSESSAETSRTARGGAQSGARGATGKMIDADLAMVVDIWPTLPEAIQARILAMIKAAD
jgi:hypothetical protein